MGKGENAGNQHFPTMFSTISKTKIIIYVTFILSSADAFNLDKVKFLSSGNGLIKEFTTQSPIEKLDFVFTLHEKNAKAL